MATAREDSCTSCHLERATVDTVLHVLEWHGSIHERHDVSCSACHGGDPAAFQEFQAHQGVLHSDQEASPTHFRRLPSTCGRCHRAIALAYEQSRHHELLLDGDRRTPTCSTCHGAAALQALSAGGLRGGCGSCHVEESGPLSAEPVLRGRDLLIGYRELRPLKRRLTHRVKKLRGTSQGAALTQRLKEADGHWNAGAVAGHGFDYDAMERSLASAREAYLSLAEDLGLDPKMP